MRVAGNHAWCTLVRGPGQRPYYAVDLLRSCNMRKLSLRHFSQLFAKTTLSLSSVENHTLSKYALGVLAVLGSNDVAFVGILP
jgi:hypothetical protein